MKHGWIIILGGLLGLSQVFAQELHLVLPDTAIHVTDAGRALPALERALRSAGLRGQLGTAYRLQSISMDSSLTDIVLRFHEESVSIPLPDTMIITDEQGRGLPHLEPYLQGVRNAHVSYLYSGERPGWQIGEKTYFRSDNGYGIRYDMRDISNQTVQVIAGYDRQGAERGELVGEIALDLPNFLGTLRYLHIYWRRLSDVTQSMKFAYSEPRLPILPVGGQLAFRQALRDTMYIERHIKVQLTSTPDQEWNTAIGVGSRTLHVTDHGIAQGLRSYQQHSINLSLQRQTYDHPANPVKGWQFALDCECGTLSGIAINSQAALAQFEMQVGAVWTPSKITFAQEIQATGIVPWYYSPQISEYGRFGGGKSLRGYREDQFLTPWGIVSRTEFRLPAGTAARWHLFIDNGHLAGIPWLMSLGTGVVLRADRELIQLDLAWNREDSFRSAKLHLRLIGLLAGD